MRTRDGLPDYETGVGVFLWNKCFHSEEYLNVVDDRLRDVFIGTYVGPGKTIRVIYFEALLTLCLFEVIYILQLLS